MTKLDPTGSALVYSTFLGGSNFEWGRGLAVDTSGNVYVAGQTKSSDFPTTGGAFDRTFNVDTCPRCGIDQYDAFVTKLNASGSALVYSTSSTDLQRQHRHPLGRCVLREADAPPDEPAHRGKDTRTDRGP